MDDSYLYTPPDPSAAKAVKWLLALLVLRVKRPLSWAAFLALNPLIRLHLAHWVKARNKDPQTVDRRVRKLSNLVSVAFLYSAVAPNARVPKDYVLLYLFEQYYLLNPPSLRIVTLPTTARWFKLRSYGKDSWVRRLYVNKHYVVFPAIFGQILSNYLTPTRYKLNQRYLSSSIKSHLLNPIWINFRMGVRSQLVNWAGLLASYARLNGLVFAYYALASFHLRFLRHYLWHGENTQQLRSVLRNYLAYCFHRANSLVNFIFEPSLLAMVLLSLTAPMLTNVPLVKGAYMANMKQFVKNYFKVVGFVAALGLMALHSMDFVPSFGYRPLPHDRKDEPRNIRSLTPQFFDDVNMYLFRLIVLSKWRILKENHPWFSVFKFGTWQRIEAAAMCYAVWKLMNLNDYIQMNRYGPAHAECEQLEQASIIKAVNRIMT